MSRSVTDWWGHDAERCLRPRQCVEEFAVGDKRSRIHVRNCFQEHFLRWICYLSDEVHDVAYELAKLGRELFFLVAHFLRSDLRSLLVVKAATSSSGEIRYGERPAEMPGSFRLERWQHAGQGKMEAPLPPRILSRPTYQKAAPVTWASSTPPIIYLRECECGPPVRRGCLRQFTVSPPPARPSAGGVGTWSGSSCAAGCWIVRNLCTDPR